MSEEVASEVPERKRFVCAAVFHDPPKCDHSSARRWRGPCPGCRGWWNPVDTERFYAPRARKEKPARFDSEVEPIKRTPTGLAYFDEVIGGGIVEGAVIILGGKRGSGKSTFLVMLLNTFATERRRALYASAEENKDEVLHIVQRIGAQNPHVTLLGNAFNLDDIFEQAELVKPKLMVIDSLPAVTDGVAIDSGTESSRALQVLNLIMRFSEKHKICTIVVNHVNRQHEFAGGEKAEHYCKAILAFFPYHRGDDGDLAKVMSNDDARRLGKTTGAVRVLFGMGKNRIGPSDEKRFFEMTDAGILVPIPKKPTLSLVD